MRKGGCILAFDFGLKHIGVAAGQTITGQARGVTTIRARDGKPDWQQIQSLVADYGPIQLIVGLPLNMDGTESALSARARQFSLRLGRRAKLPLALWDERLTTREANAHLDRARVAGVAQTSHELAAVLIAESWLAHSAQAAE